MEDLQKETIEYKELAEELIRMKAVDQTMIKNFREGKEEWDSTLYKTHSIRMKEIVGEIGWPTLSKVGLEGMKAAWILVQHADHDVDFQKECLELMKVAPEEEVRKIDIAYLDDRIKVNSGQPQLYGTQFRPKNGEHVPCPIEDEEKVDERRKEMGMDTLADQIKLMYDSYGIPKE